MSDESEYISNPRLRVLSEELAILNDILIKKNLPDRIRLFQLREFALASRQITGISYPQLQLVQADTDDFEWSVIFKGEILGKFATPTLALKAYTQRHIDYYGVESEYHPEHPIDDSHLHDLPPGIQLTTEGKYRAVLYTNGIAYPLGIFGTIEAATETLKQAKAKTSSLQPALKRDLPCGVYATTNGKFKAKTANQHIGVFDTQQEASEAFQQYTGKAANAATARAARSQKTATKRQASAERYADTPLPTGVRMIRSGMFSARIKTGTGEHKKETHLGVFDTPEEAHDAYKRSHVRYHGTASQYYNEQMKEAA